jgi:hypothetical protein
MSATPTGVTCYEFNIACASAAVLASIRFVLKCACQLARAKRILRAMKQDHSCMYVIFLYCDDAQL